MTDFWADYDKSYRLFSQFCDSDDWHRLLKAVAGCISTSWRECAEPLKVLDVGCGNGLASQTVCEHIYAKRGQFPRLTAVEPSPIAQGRMSGYLLGAKHGGPLAASHRAVARLGAGERFHAIMVLHASYYIDKLKETCKRLVSNHLLPSGVICFLVLPRESPFFLGLPPLKHCAEDVEAILRSIGLEVSDHVLRSRFYLPSEDSLTDTQWGLLKRFVAPKVDQLAEFKRLAKESLGSSQAPADFGDRLVIGRARK